MTEQDIRIALTEHLYGWVRRNTWSSWMDDPKVPGSDAQLPPHLTLDWMHEIEKTLSAVQHRQYWTQLSMYTAGVGMYPGEATATQRAEAFLKTIGKWTGP